MLSTNVKLLKHQLPIFPDRCVVCGVDRPGRTTKVSDRTLTLWSLLFWLGGEKVVIHVPSCRWCGWRLRLRYSLEFVTTLAVFAMYVIWVYPRIPHWGPRLLRMVVGMAGFFVAMIPVVIVRLYVPPAFDFDAGSDENEYQFRNARYAEEFGDLNHTWQSIVRRSNPYRDQTELEDDDPDEKKEDDDVDDAEPDDQRDWREDGRRT